VTEHLSRQRYLEEALAVQRETVSLFPHDVVSRNGLAVTLRELDRLEEALQVLEETVTTFPHDLFSRNSLADTLLRLSRHEDALVVYRETIALSPNDIVSRNGIAEVLKQLGRLDEAGRFYRETIEMFPHGSVSRQGLADTLRRTSKFNDALVLLRELVATNPEDVVAASMLADTLLRLGDLDNAIKMYRGLIRRFPDNPILRNGLSEALRHVARVTRLDDIGASKGRYRYQVALSFAGEDRLVAGQIADELVARGVSVFYDQYEKASLWGKDLYAHLSRVYAEEAQYCVVVISEHYARKLWPRHELRHAQERAFREKREYLLPIRLDDTTIPGISETVGYIDLRKDTLASVIQAVLRKLADVDVGTR
jgi:tetratricopeptide (TPR) repeat protein